MRDISDHPFSPERPIETLAEDELGRKDFATAVAKVIGQWSGRDSLVLAIYGPWGSGKTSLKNMILDALRKQKAKTIPLEFNPWEWAGQEKVFEGFFGELSSKLGSVDASKQAAEAAKKMRMYAAMLSAAASITGSGRSLLIGVLGVLAFFGLAPLFHSPGLVTTVTVLGASALLGAVALAVLGKTADSIAGYLTAKAEAIRKSVAEVKKELHGLLGTLRQNVLVVVDDVDRLTPQEIRMVFQLVKANADFPTLVYLLLFQRDTIEKALGRMGEAGEVDGAEFLQKVVQAGFDIPKLNPKKLEESLESVISRIVEDSPADARFDSRRWGKLFVSGISPYFQTLRDVKRFSNTLAFHFELYRNSDSFDANPVDLIALEVLRQFEAPVYQRLPGSRALLTGVPREAFGASFTGEKKKAVEALFENANRPNEVREILTDVFPTIIRAVAESVTTDLGDMPPDAAFRNEWLKDLRPCHPDVFERYFRFSLSTEDLSEGEVFSLLAVMGDRNNFVKKLREINRKGLLGAAVLRLRAHSLSVPNESTVPFVTGLLDVERELFGQQSGSRVAAVPAEIQAVLIIGSVLRQRPVEARGSILREAIAQTTALYLPMISFESSDEERKQAVDPLVSDQEAKSLQKLCVEKIDVAKLKPELLSHPRLAHILHFWSKWGSPQEVAVWFEQSSGSDPGLLSLISAFIEQQNEIDEGRTVAVRYRFALEAFARYMKPDDVAERVRRLASSEEHRVVYRLVLRAFDRWKRTGRNPGPRDLDEWTTLERL